MEWTSANYKYTRSDDTYIYIYRYGETVVTTKKTRGSDGDPSALFIHPD